MIRSMCAISRVAAEFINFRRDEFEHLVQQFALVHFTFAAEVDQFAVEPVTRRAPAILIDQTPRVHCER